MYMNFYYTAGLSGFHTFEADLDGAPTLSVVKVKTCMGQARVTLNECDDLALVLSNMVKKQKKADAEEEGSE